LINGRKEEYQGATRLRSSASQLRFSAEGDAVEQEADRVLDQEKKRKQTKVDISRKLAKAREETKLQTILKIGMLPVTLALALAVFIGAFGSSATPASADFGEICRVDWGWTGGGPLSPVANQDGQGNSIIEIHKGVTYGAVFYVDGGEGNWSGYTGESKGVSHYVVASVDSEGGSALITSKSVKDGHALVQPGAGEQEIQTLGIARIKQIKDRMEFVNEFLEDIASTPSRRIRLVTTSSRARASWMTSRARKTTSVVRMEASPATSRPSTARR
jgi:hypothetical protein